MEAVFHQVLWCPLLVQPKSLHDNEHRGQYISILPNSKRRLVRPVKECCSLASQSILSDDPALKEIFSNMRVIFLPKSHIRVAVIGGRYYKQFQGALMVTYIVANINTAGQC